MAEISPNFDQLLDKNSTLSNKLIFKSFYKNVRETYLKEPNRIEILLDLEKTTATLKIDGKTVSEQQNTSNKVKLKSIKKKVDSEIYSTMLRMKSELVTSNKIEHTVILFKAQIMEQLVEYYDISDIFQKNLFKGIFYSKKKSRNKKNKRVKLSC